jgi:hypothetical protein
MILMGKHYPKSVRKPKKWEDQMRIKKQKR